MADDEVDLHEQEVRQCAQELARARLELDRIKPQLAHAGRELARVHASRSWQFTRPLRVADRVLRRWLGGHSAGDPHAG